MAGTPDYGKWIRDALAANPKLTKSGLSRHLRHGLDRSRVLKMIDGRRRIQVDEIAAIASYLGVPPPALKVAPSSRHGPETPCMGKIETRIWHEGTPQGHNMRGISVPARPDERWPAEDQGCYEMATAVPSLKLEPGDFVIAYHGRMQRRTPGDVFVVLRTRGELSQFGLAKVVTGEDGALEALTGQQPETGKPVALVIGLFRPMA